MAWTWRSQVLFQKAVGSLELLKDGPWYDSIRNFKRLLFSLNPVLDKVRESSYEMFKYHIFFVFVFINQSKNQDVHLLNCSDLGAKV